MSFGRTLTAIALGLYSVIAAGDEWELPVPTRYCSVDGRFCLNVLPKAIESQLRYFGDHVSGAENPGAGHGRPTTASAVLEERKADGTYRVVCSLALLNEVAPVTALVAPSGKYFVTFDNWHTLGYGDNVVTSYRGDGSVAFHFGLSDFLTEAEIAALPHSVSSIWWGGEHYLDESARQLVLKVNVSRALSFEAAAEYRDVRLDLETGSIVP